MEEWMYLRQNAPEECYVQIGDSFGHPDMETFHECFTEWLTWQNEWNDSHGNPFTILDVAEHFAEEVPQAHIRRVWSYVDENGNRRLGQEKALAMAGVELPEQYIHDIEGNLILGEDNKPLTSIPKRYNNRKMTFDSLARENGLKLSVRMVLKSKIHQESMYNIILIKEKRLYSNLEWQNRILKKKWNVLRFLNLKILLYLLKMKD